MSIVLQGSTSGSVTLQEPAVAGTTVLDLPAVSGTVLTTGSSGQSIPRAALPAGSVLQTVYTQSSTTVTTVNITSLLSASITPISSSSRILILAMTPFFCTASSDTFGLTRIYRGTTSGTILSTLSVGKATAGVATFTTTHVYLDSPATTSSTTYTLGFARGSSGTTDVSTDGALYSLTLMEIAT